LGDVPAVGPVELPAEAKDLVMHVELPILGGHLLMATDMLESMGQHTRIGNDMTICLAGRPRRVGKCPDGGYAVQCVVGRRSRPLRRALDGQLHGGLNSDERQEAAWVG
jgi:hypothetical protein